MALSRFWTWMLLLSIAYILIMLFTGQQYSLGSLVNGKQGEPLVVNEIDTADLRGTLLLEELRRGDAPSLLHGDTL